MTISASTPRIRTVQLWYVIVLVLVAVSERTELGAWAGAVGLALMMAAALGRVWTSAHIAGHKDAMLVTFGPYSVCRHPLYAFSLLGGAGVGLASRSVLILLATVLVLGALHLRAIGREERGLHARYGAVFEAYRQKVPMLWPSLRRHELRAETTLNLRLFRKAFLDAGSFLALYLLIVLLEAGRAAGVWPTLFSLW